MITPAALHRALEIDLTPATFAHLTATFMLIVASSQEETTPDGLGDTTIPVIRAELDAIALEIRELRADAAIAARMPATVAWRREITADRKTLTRRTTHLREVLDAALAAAPPGGRS